MKDRHAHCFPSLINCILQFFLDQSCGKNVTHSFKPTPENNSFQQPKTDMNVASGFPKFAKLAVLDGPSFIKENVMYVKCVVDKSKIFHP